MFLDGFKFWVASLLYVLARGAKKWLCFYMIFVSFESPKRASELNWQIWQFVLFSMLMILFYFDFSWKCFSWCYIHHLYILYIFLNLLKSFAILFWSNVITCNYMHLFTSGFILFFCNFILIKCSSQAFVFISFILFLIKPWLIIFNNFVRGYQRNIICFFSLTHM